MPDWKLSIDWDGEVNRVRKYYDDRPNLEYGAKKKAKAFPLLDELCGKGSLTQADAMQLFGLSMDGVMTILSNVTAAIQGKGGGKVWAPAEGGWYKTIVVADYTYSVCPGFAAAWNATKGLSSNKKP